MGPLTAGTLMAVPHENPPMDPHMYHLEDGHREMRGKDRETRGKDSHRVTQYKRKGKDRGKDNRTRGKIEVSRRKRWKGRIGKCYKCTVKRY